MSISNVDNKKNLGGKKGESLKVTSEEGLLLQQILLELKIVVKILNEVHDLNVNERDLI